MTGQCALWRQKCETDPKTMRFNKPSPLLPMTRESAPSSLHSLHISYPALSPVIEYPLTEIPGSDEWI